VHGAKGLEAPIVILPDTATKKNTVREEILDVQGVPIWKPGADLIPQVAADERDAIAERQLQEKDRLLYVAMTRAEKWLIVAGAGDVDGGNSSWYRQVESGLGHAGAVTQTFAAGDGLRLESGAWEEHYPEGASQSTPEGNVVLPDWVDQPVSAPKAGRKTISPSGLGGEKIVFDRADAEGDQDKAMLYGTIVHYLLETLPEIEVENRETHGQNLLERWGDVSVNDCASALEEALKVLKSPALETVFAAESLPEVSLSADISDDLRLHGIVDRLIVGPDSICAVDFKTNRIVPDETSAVPEGILRQMGAYTHALQQIFPDKKITTAILWTKTAKLMELPHDLVSAAFARAAIP